MKKVRIAMIGFGGIARTHYAGYTDLATRNVPFELVAICDIDKTQFEKHHPSLFQGQALHAKKLTLTHPKTGERMVFECELPDEFKKALELLDNQQ